MNVNWTKDSVLSTSDHEKDKEWIKDTIDIFNDYLEAKGSVFVNDLLEGLCIKPKKRYLKDGWYYDPLDSEFGKIKAKFKEENGNLIIVLNEERDIVNLAFDE